MKIHRWALVLLVWGFLFRAVAAFFMPAGFDEAYYYLYTQNIHLSYFDHPPLVAWVAGIGIWLTGVVSPLTLRLGSVVLYTGTLWCLYQTARSLFGGLALITTESGTTATMAPVLISSRVGQESGSLDTLANGSSNGATNGSANGNGSSNGTTIDQTNQSQINKPEIFSVSGERIALMTLAIATTIPIFQIAFGILVLPDSPLMFFWSMSLWVASQEFFGARSQDSFLSPVFNYRPSWRLALLGLTVGLATLGKYHGMVLGFGLVAFCVLSVRHRRALWSPWAAAGLAAFLIAILPILIWNANHEWASLAFQSGRAVPTAGYRIGDLLLTFLVGVAYLFPSIGFVMWWAGGKATTNLLSTGWQHWRKVGKVSAKSAQSQRRRSHNWFQNIGYIINYLFRVRLNPLQERRLMVLCVALPLVLGLTIMGGYRQILPTWTMPGFFSGTLLLAEWVVRWQDNNPKAVRNWLFSAAVISVTLMLIALSHIHSGIFQKGGNQALGGGLVEAKNDDSTQLIDIEQLRRNFVENPLLKAELAKSDFIFSNNFFVTGQVGMALQPLGKPVTCFDQDLRGFAYWTKPTEFIGKSGLYVMSEQFGEPLSKYADQFDQITPIADVPLYRGGQVVQMFRVYRTSPLRVGFPRLYGQR
jgi:4-amino-4-deoxy-L-arabinose transferase-like glycosyltransferase